MALRQSDAILSCARFIALLQFISRDVHTAELARVTVVTDHTVFRIEDASDVVTQLGLHRWVCLHHYLIRWRWWFRAEGHQRQHTYYGSSHDQAELYETCLT